MRFRTIDASNIADHTYLKEGDVCLYLHEYTSRSGYSFGPANDLISNLKKPVNRRHKPEYAYKMQAITTCSNLITAALNTEWLKIGTLVPTPPSKAKDDRLYDDRLIQVCKGVISDVREIVRQKATIRSAHENPDNRPTVAELEAIYEIDETFSSPTPKSIAIVDDVLTAGTHFRAMHNVLIRRFPTVPMAGIFIARRVFPNNAAFDADRG